MDNARQQWLDGLQIGDEVALVSYRYSTCEYELLKIVRITPKRRFSVEGRSTEFDSTGKQRGKGGAWDIPMEIEPVTQKVKDHLRKRNIVGRLNNTKWVHLELPRLEQIIAALDSDDEGPQGIESNE